MDANNREPNAHGVAAEPDRVPASVAVGFGALLVAACVVAAVLMAALFRGFDKAAVKKDDAAIAAAGLERRQDALPPVPRLQVYPVRHWKDFRSAEAERLSSYGWMDRSTGAVHLPIERAMDLVAQRGVAPLATAPVATPVPAKGKK